MDVDEGMVQPGSKRVSRGSSINPVQRVTKGGSDRLLRRLI